MRRLREYGALDVRGCQHGHGGYNRRSHCPPWDAPLKRGIKRESQRKSISMAGRVRGDMARPACFFG